MEQRNLFIAMAASLVILLGWNVMFPPPKPAVKPTTTVSADGTPIAPANDAAVPGPPREATGPAAITASGEQARGLTRTAALNQSARVTISTPRLAGSIALTGASLDDLTLSTYKQTLAEDSPPITLLSPSGGPDAYFARFGWSATPGKEASVPTSKTEWRSNDRTLTENSSVTMTWESPDGLVYERTIALDDGYMFTVTDVVKNNGADAATLYPYSLVSRAGEPETSGLYVLHEGPIGVLNGTLEELSYDDLLDDGQSGTIVHETTGGWLGITDKYWLAALVPPADEPVKARFLHTAAGGVDRFQTDYLGGAVAIPPGESRAVTHRFFGGAKEVGLLDRYEAELNIPLFDKAIDFGWFYYLTKPFFYALEWLYGLLGNFGLAIMALTVGVKIVFFPLANKSYKSMAAMKRLQPEMLKLRERFGEDRQKLNQEMMALYKKEKVNPASGCLPIIVQIPVFFSLYKVLIVAIEMRHAPFFGWIKDLSAPDPTNMFNLFGLLPFTPPSFLHIGAWAVMMGITMFLQQKLNPQPTDPMQARIFMLMPLIFTVLLSGFAAGLVIYWTWNNLLSIAQQAIIMTRAGVPLGGGEKKKPAAGKA